jgi:hypothetical protein
VPEAPAASKIDAAGAAIRASERRNESFEGQRERTLRRRNTVLFEQIKEFMFNVAANQ